MLGAQLVWFLDFCQPHLALHSAQLLEVSATQRRARQTHAECIEQFRHAFCGTVALYMRIMCLSWPVLAGTAPPPQQHGGGGGMLSGLGGMVAQGEAPCCCSWPLCSTRRGPSAKSLACLQPTISALGQLIQPRIEHRSGWPSLSQPRVLRREMRMQAWLWAQAALWRTEQWTAFWAAATLSPLRPSRQPSRCSPLLHCWSASFAVDACVRGAAPALVR